MLLRLLQELPPEIRGTTSIFILSAALIWMINALDARPDTTPAHKAVKRTCLPLERDDDGSWITVKRGGAWFIHRLADNGHCAFEIPLHRTSAVTDGAGTLVFNKPVRLGDILQFIRTRDEDALAALLS